MNAGITHGGFMTTGTARPGPGGWVLLLLVGVGLLLGLPGGGQAGEIRLGEINPLTGHLAKHGQEIHQGILYAVEEVNGRGGIAGRQVRLISRDDQSRPEVALNQVQDLITREGIAALVGGYVDSLVGPVSELAARCRVPYVASASLQRSLTAHRNPYFFRVSRLEGMVRPLCRFLVEGLKAKKVALVHVGTPGSTEFAAEVKACLEQAGVAIPIMEKVRAGTPDFSVVLLKVKQAGVEVLVSGGFYAENLILVRQLAETPLGLKAFVAPWGVAYPSFLGEMGRAAEGLLGTCAWNPGITWPGTEEVSQAFVQGFKARFGELPNTTTMHGYVSARALVAAMAAVVQAGGEPRGEALAQALRELDLVLPMERLKFDDHGDPQFYEHVVIQVQQGRIVAVFPPERAGSALDLSAAGR
jgi:branched-chain amino acid transport system substrate-binding protein